MAGQGKEKQRSKGANAEEGEKQGLYYGEPGPGHGLHPLQLPELDGEKYAFSGCARGDPKNPAPYSKLPAYCRDN
jgi:hypothetical protein